MAETFTKITASCACTAFELQVDFPTSSLPIDRALCLCRVCRQSSGSCGLSYIGIPSTYSIKPSEFNLTRYDTSESLARYFCSTCGAHVACNPVGEDEWYLSTGLWDQTEAIVNWTGCIWVEDTLDGGISIWLTEILDSSGTKKALKRWVLQEGANPEVAFNTLRVFERSEPSEKLKASCHCGGVQFSITRPNAISKEASSPFPDLKVPFHTGLSAANPDNEPWWLMDQDTKYLAGLCTCTSCRLNSGFEIQPWAFIPKFNIIQENGEPLDYQLGTLKTYQSSPNVWREFCGVCGATVFWHCLERPSLVDVSVGLFDPEEGARVESWLSWSLARVSFQELAVSKSLITSLADGMKNSGSP